MNKTKIFKEIINKPELTIIPGAPSALFAKLIEESGFKAVYATGAGISNMQLGWADVGLISMYEVLETVRRIVDATNLPVIADIDTGFGNPINVYRTVREFEKAGVAAIQLEDQTFPKKCGHFSGKDVISKEEMVSKIKAAKDALINDDFSIIARTDAIAVHGLGDAIDRGNAYLEAGADILFIEAPLSIEQIGEIPKHFQNTPLIANMVEGGKTPLISREDLEKMGYQIALYANAPMRAAIKAVENVLAHLHEVGTTKDILNDLITMERRNQLTKLPFIKELEKKYKVRDDI